ncbi:unnamed protein product, partial [Closterium sp. NIES-54]
DTLADGSSYASLLMQPSASAKEIERDVNRTFPNHRLFQEERGAGQQSLFNVIKAYSVLDKEVGYCQGMGFIAATLLMSMGEEHAFTCLVFLMYRCGLRGVFLPDMQQLQVRMYQLTQLLIHTLPRVHAFFEHLDIKPVMYAADWFLTLFARTMPHYLVFRVFDIILAEQTTAIVFKLAIVLLQVCRRQLQQCPEMEYAMCLLRTELPAQLKEVSEEEMEELVYKAMRVDLPFESLLRLEAEYDLLAGEAAAAARDVQAAAEASEAAALSWGANRQQLEARLCHATLALKQGERLAAHITATLALSESAHHSSSYPSPCSTPPPADTKPHTCPATVRSHASASHAACALRAALHMGNGVGGPSESSHEPWVTRDSSGGGMRSGRAGGGGCLLVNGSGVRGLEGSRPECLNGASCTEEGRRPLECGEGEERVCEEQGVCEEEGECEEGLPLEERVQLWEERVAVVGGGNSTVETLRAVRAAQHEWVQVGLALALAEREVACRLDMGAPPSDSSAALGALMGGGAQELVVVEVGGCVGENGAHGRGSMRQYDAVKR